MIFSTTRQVNHLYESLYFGFVISLVTGIFPMIPIKRNGVYRLTASNNMHFFTGINYVIMAWICLKSLEVQLSTMMLENMFELALVRYGALAIVLFGGFAMYFIFFISFLFKDHVRATYEDLADVDDKLASIGIELNYRLCRNIQDINLGIIVTSIVAGETVIYFLGTLYFTAECRFTNFYIWTIIIYPLGMTTIYLCQFGVILYIIISRYHLVNKHLLDMLDESTTAVLPKIGGEQIRSKPPRDLLHELNTLMYVHYQLSAIPEKSCMYLLAMIPIVFLQFSMMTYSAFNVFYMNQSMPFETACWSLLGLYKFWQIVKITIGCHLAKWASEITGRNVHKILIRTKNKRIEDKLMVFSNQILQHTCNFTLSGLMNLDATLLFNTLAASTTYLVILVQFQEGPSTPDCRQYTKTPAIY